MLRIDPLPEEMYGSVWFVLGVKSCPFDMKVQRISSLIPGTNLITPQKCNSITNL